MKRGVEGESRYVSDEERLKEARSDPPREGRIPGSRRRSGIIFPLKRQRTQSKDLNGG